MNKHQDVSSAAGRAAPKRSIPTPRIVKPPPSADGTKTQTAATDPTLPLKPANVLKSAHAQKYSPWLTTAKMPTKVVPRIP